MTNRQAHLPARNQLVRGQQHPSGSLGQFLERHFVFSWPALQKLCWSKVYKINISVDRSMAYQPIFCMHCAPCGWPFWGEGVLVLACDQPKWIVHLDNELLLSCKHWPSQECPHYHPLFDVVALSVNFIVECKSCLLYSPPHQCLDNFFFPPYMSVHPCSALGYQRQTSSLRDG